MDRVIVENKRLKNENIRYQESTKLLSQKITEMNEYAKKLNIIAGIEPEKDKNQYGGIGDLNGGEQKLSGQFLEKDIPQLKTKAFAVEKNLHFLLTHFEKESLLLASTPSIWPVRGYVSAYFRYRKDPFTGTKTFHKGIDISTPVGTPIVAPADGIVAAKARKGGYGNFLIIKHKFGYTTRYGHLQRFNVKKGQLIKRGDVIAYVGSSGKSTGPHLHYEVSRNGQAENPLHYIIEEYKVFKH